MTLLDVQLGDPDACRHLADYLVGEIADLVLGIEQHGDERGPAQGIASPCDRSARPRRD